MTLRTSKNYDSLPTLFDRHEIATVGAVFALWTLHFMDSVSFVGCHGLPWAMRYSLTFAVGQGHTRDASLLEHSTAACEDSGNVSRDSEVPRGPVPQLWLRMLDVRPWWALDLLDRRCAWLLEKNPAIDMTFKQMI